MAVESKGRVKPEVFAIDGLQELSSLCDSVSLKIDGGGHFAVSLRIDGRTKTFRDHVEGCGGNEGIASLVSDALKWMEKTYA